MFLFLQHEEQAMSGSNDMMERLSARGAILAERWENMPKGEINGYGGARSNHINFLEGIPKAQESKRANLALMYENTLNWLRNLDEATRMQMVGSFEKFVFPMIRALYANLVVKDLVTVHPLDAPTGLVFFFDVLYGSNRGGVAQGQKSHDVRTGPSGQFLYTTEQIMGEQLGTGDGATAAYAGNLAHLPCRAGTIVITDGTQRVVDNGNGVLTGDVAVNGTFNYATGAYNLVFAAAVANGTAITVDYEQDLEANADIPEMDLQLTSSPVTARPQKLRARWSIEAQQDFRAYHGIDAEAELVGFMANEIAKEINYRIIRHINTVAAAGATTWNRTPAAGVPWIWHKESFYDALIQTSNLIYNATQRVRGTWLWAGLGVCNVLETLSKFERSGPTPTDGAGPQVIGRIGRFDPVVADPSFAENSFIMGYKGSSFLDTGYIWAPYLPLYTTGTIVLDDMIARKAMAQRSGLKVVNANMYATGTITQTGGAFTP
jgi:hypothetical protein